MSTRSPRVCLEENSVCFEIHCVKAGNSGQLVAYLCAGQCTAVIHMVEKSALVLDANLIYRAQWLSCSV